MARSPREQRPRRNHNRRSRISNSTPPHRDSSSGALLPRSGRRDDSPRDDTPYRSPQRSPRRPDRKIRVIVESETSRTSCKLSEGSLAKLDALNEKLGWSEYDQVQYRVGEREERRHVDEKPRPLRIEKRERERRTHRDDRDRNHYGERNRHREERRVVSDPLLEEGGGNRRGHGSRTDGGSGGSGGQDSEQRDRKRTRRKRLWILAGIIALVLTIAIPVGISTSRNKKADASLTTDGTISTSSTNSSPSNSNLDSISNSSIPVSAQGTYLDPFTWYDTDDFNVTYTNVTVGGLYVMGLNSTWDDNVRANDDVPLLTEEWAYGTTPVRGVNLGGWLSIEPFITPSLFNTFNASDGVIDEWTLCTQLGATQAKATIEEHYSSFVSEQTFADIQAAGFDHVRIPYSYWAVTTYDGDPYVPQVAWRYLLRGIEWARKHGLRVNLDLHGLPGSQNGWNHSGHQGVIGWLNGTDGNLNAQRSLDIHRQLSVFFAQPRYNNLVSMYGLVNEPKMVAIDTNSVLNWTESAVAIVRESGMPASTIIVFGDGFLGLANWQGKLPASQYPNLLLDAHQYVIFNNDQIALDHTAKINFACAGWTQQTQQSMNTSTGYGSFLCGEWSQADTDCQTYLNDVNVGSRWEGNMNTGNVTTSVTTPLCPAATTGKCSCSQAIADPSEYSSVYKQWLLMFAEAQMYSFELGWGWFYWTWQTETATQWSWKAGVQAGTLPSDVRVREFNCSGTVPDFAAEGLSEAY